VANECFNNRIRYGEPRVLRKLDLEKAYDIEEMWIYGEMKGLDSALYFYGAVFRSYS